MIAAKNYGRKGGLFPESARGKKWAIRDRPGFAAFSSGSLSMTTGMDFGSGHEKDGGQKNAVFYLGQKGMILRVGFVRAVDRWTRGIVATPKFRR